MLGESVASLNAKDIEQFFNSLIQQRSENDNSGTEEIDVSDSATPNTDPSNGIAT